MRTRKKSLVDYRRLFQLQQDQVLSYRPRLAEYEKTVLTAWEMNFSQVERDSPKASALFNILCFLDASNVSEVLLDRGCSPQRRWNKEGEICKLMAADAGLDEQLVETVTNDEVFDAAIDRLQSFSLIQGRVDDKGSRSFSVHPLVQHCAIQRMSCESDAKWRLQAILLICHAFPRDQYLEPL